MTGKVNEIAQAKKLMDDLWAEVGQARAERDAAKTKLADADAALVKANAMIHGMEGTIKRLEKELGQARQAGTPVPVVK